MSDPLVIHGVNVALRAGLVALLLLLAAVLWRDQGRSVAARLGAACALGVAAYALCAVVGPAGPPGLWFAPLAVLSTGNALVFWLLSRALFDDAFVLRAWHGVAWALLAGAGLIGCYALPPNQPAGQALGSLILLVTQGLSLLAVGQSLASWRADLVEGRRRLRIFIVGAGAAYTLLNTGTRLVLHPAPAAELASLVDALGLAGLVAPIVWRLLGSQGSELFVVPPVPPVPVLPPPLQGPPEMPPSPALPLAGAPLTVAEAEAEAEAEAVDPASEVLPSPADAGLIAALDRLMAHDRIYREEGLTIGALAQRLGVPEHRLRRLINQHLGYRNFNQYLNGYRLAQAKAVLADATMGQVPVLTIAMDAGFQSLGPFNRAFKADTGVTPSEYRRRGGPAAATDAAPRLAGSELAA